MVGRRFRDLKRYLLDFDTNKLETEYFDVVIIGSGIAGVYTALQIENDVNVCILTKEQINISNSVLAQGGIAVSLDKEDSPELHFKDTIYAGAGLCDEDTVWTLVKEAAENIHKLCSFGVNFDKGENKELALSREAAHSKKRIIHTGDSTGKEVCDTLIAQVRKCPNVRIDEQTCAVDILTKDDQAVGVLAFDSDRRLKVYGCKIVICASGGFGQLYTYTTNPEVSTGDGLALSFRAGAEVMDLEFIQFHPTVLYHPDNKSFLISEAVRGEGAYLRNNKGERFMERYHEMKELAPRDVVSRAIFQEMKKTGTTHVFLDITHKDEEFLRHRFPTIYKTCMEHGMDISKDYIPVAPAEHYCMGGIRTDENGRSNLHGLYACGEAACNGIHGANRLASNSLLEGLVFGRRIGREVSILVKENKAEQKPINLINKDNIDKGSFSAQKIRDVIKKTMNDKVGMIRSRQSLEEALGEIISIKDKVFNKDNSSIEMCEAQNMILLAELVIRSALIRQESRGAHYREDYPGRNDADWRKNIIMDNSILEGKVNV